MRWRRWRRGRCFSQSAWKTGSFASRLDGAEAVHAAHVVRAVHAVAPRRDSLCCLSILADLPRERKSRSTVHMSKRLRPARDSGRLQADATLGPVNDDAILLQDVPS